MNCKSIRKNLKSVITNLITVVIGLVFFQSCSDDILTGQPSWLGNSIYEYLQDQGDYTNTIKLINDLDYATVLNQTGSKTLFVANDDAYTEFFKSNKWGVHSYDELSMAQKKLLLNSSMVNNAYLIELLSSIPGTPPLEGRCMRRESAITIYDSVAHILPSQMPQTNYWNKYRNKTNGIVLMRDNSPAPIIHFLPKYMQVNSITDEDLQILTNGASNSVSDAWVNGKKIIDRDITCKNGYVQKLDGVMTSADNMAEIIRGHKNMSVWTHLMNRYCAPYYDDTSTKQYNRLYNNSDSVFVLKYFSSCSKSGTTKVDPDGNTVSSLLTFDPEWNQYIQNDGSGQTLNYDCGAMLVPSNEAMSYWWEHDGLALQTEYGTMDNVPDNVMLQLINVHMIPSFANHVPSKFSNITNDANMEMGVTKADVDSCFMGCNGVVYLTNKVFSPAAYSSVSFPALIRSNSNMAIIYWAIKNLGFSQYLNSMDSYYSMLLPTDNAFLNYIDPCSYGSSTTVLYKFKWSTEKQAPQIERYRYNMNTHTVIDKIDTRDVGTNKSSDLGANRLYDIVDNLIIVDKLVDGKNYYKTKGGATVRISNHDVKGAMTVSEGMEEKALGKTLTVSEIYDQTRSGNGKSYEIDGGVPLSTNKSVYATLKDNSEYSRFFDLISGGDDNNPDENLMVNLIDKKYSCVDYNIRLFNAYNYTVWVPTNASIEKLHEEGILPYWSDFEAQTAAAWGNDNEKAIKMKTIIKNRIMNFLKYHIQDNSVYVGGETISGNNYETSVMNQTNHKYYTLTVNSDNSNLTVKDILGDIRSVVKTSGAYNNMCREYLYNNTDKESAYNSTLYSSSYAVVHLIDGPLLYDKMTPMSFIPGGTQAKKFYAKRRNTKR